MQQRESLIEYPYRQGIRVLTTGSGPDLSRTWTRHHPFPEQEDDGQDDRCRREAVVGARTRAEGPRPVPLAAPSGVRHLTPVPYTL